MKTIDQYPLVLDCSSESPLVKGSGFCACDDGHKAKRIPDGTYCVAEVSLCCRWPDPEEPKYLEYLCRGKDDKLYLTYDFLVTTDKGGLQWMKKIIPFIDEIKQEGRSKLSDEYVRLLNSAANTFLWDKSDQAERLRTFASYDQVFGMHVISQVFVGIEIGLDKKTAYNYVKNIIEPDHPRYIKLLGLSGSALPGTGIYGKHQPPHQASSTDYCRKPNSLRKSTAEKLQGGE